MISNSTSVELYRSIAKDNKERKFKHWHASSIADCPRTHYFKRLGIKPLVKPSAAMIIRWEAGHILEEFIRPHIEKKYNNVKSNNRLTSKKLDLTGEYDNLSENTLIEIKSVHDIAFISRDGEVTLKEGTGDYNKWNKEVMKPRLTPYLGHELQNHAYALLLKEEGIEVIDIDYVYISLGGRLCVYRTKVQPELLQNVEKRLEVLNAAWKKQEPPVCICREDHPLYNSTMKWCGYKTEEGCCDLKLLEGIK